MAVKVREKVKGSGEWWLFIDHQGKRRAKKVRRDKRYAIKVAKEIEARLVLGKPVLQEKEEAPAFGHYADIWIKTVVPTTCKPSTARDYKSILGNHILPVFKNKEVTKIKRLQVRSFLAGKINDNYASSTVTHMKNAISGILNLAVDDEVIPFNPAHRIGKYSRSENKQSTINPLTRDELRQLLQSVNEHYPQHYAMTLTLARTGMRIGEVLALKWNDIDLEGRFINVERGFSMGVIETPKSGKGRKVDMSKQLTETLKALKHQRKLETLRNGWKDVPEWLFVNSQGNPLDRNNWRNRVFNKALEKAELRKVRVHDLRHTYASLLIQAGESLAYIKDQLGHHSIKVTVDIYGHLAPEGNKAAVDALDDPGIRNQEIEIRNLSATKNKKDLTNVG